MKSAHLPEGRMSSGGAAGGTEARPWIATVLVNWRGAEDTIECLESLLTSDYPHQCVVVVDNGSDDGSLAKFAQWASGQVTTSPSRRSWGEEAPRSCVKPVPFVMLDAHAALGGHCWGSGPALVFIDAGRNRGFAAGVNIGVRFALANAAVRYVWVLNNDTVVARECLSWMERRMAADPAAGMCGSRILFYREPDRVQVLGGARFQPWRGTSRLIGSLRSASDVVDPQEVERNLDHLSGASMLVARTFIEDVGLMEEGYFLYFEEMDWAIRGKGRYRLAYADDAVVYHKEGASIGSNHQRRLRSALSSFFMVRSRLRFTWKFFPWALPSVVAYSALLVLRAVVDGQHEQASAMWSALIGSDPSRALGWIPGRTPMSHPVDHTPLSGGHSFCPVVTTPAPKEMRTQTPGTPADPPEPARGRPFVAVGRRLGSIVIPAHNEAPVIGRCLDALFAGLAPGEVEVVVVCNGCTDTTASVARQSGHPITVLELEAPSKIEALRAGERAVRAFPRLFLDADVVLSGDAAKALLTHLAKRWAVAARPPIRYDAAASSWLVRRFYAARTQLPNVMGSLWGAGVYGLSAAGRSRFQDFPQVVAEDLFVDRLFTTDEVDVLPIEPVTVMCPRTARGLFRVLKRTYRGNVALAGVPGRPRPGTRATVRELAQLACRGLASLRDAIIYGSLVSLGRVVAHFGGNHIGTWERDETSRSLAAQVDVSNRPSTAPSHRGQSSPRSLPVPLRSWTPRPDGGNGIGDTTSLSGDDALEGSNGERVGPGRRPASLSEGRSRRLGSKPRIAVFGLGYVGSVSAACFAERGHKVIGVDVSLDKVGMINAGRTPVVEDRLGDLIARAVRQGSLTATTDVDAAIASTDLALVCVGTPSAATGAVSLDHLLRVANQIGAGLPKAPPGYVVAFRSTMLPGTCEAELCPRLEKGSSMKAGVDFGVCVNPEFLREGTSVADFFAPPKTVIGELGHRSGDVLASLYDGLPGPLYRVPIRVAEMTKYVDNSFHALKVGFANEIGAVCKALGLDSHQVMEIFTADTKLNVSAAYLRPGFAFGGSCLPKDLRALLHRARHADVSIPILENVLASNEAHVRRVFDLIETRQARRVGLFGLSFKGGTDDLRESPMVELAERLLGRGYELFIHDAQVSTSHLVGANRAYVEARIPHLSKLMVSSADTVAIHAEVCVLHTSDPDALAAIARAPDLAVIDLLRPPGIEAIHGRAEYIGVCW